MITETQRQYEDDRRRTIARVVGHILEHLPGVPVVDSYCLGRHPLAAVLYRAVVRGGAAAHLVVEELSRTLSCRAVRDSARFRENRLVAIQSHFVLPERETRNAILAPAAVAEFDLEEAMDRYGAALRVRMPSWWQAFVEIAASYTVVVVNGNTAPSKFSGTFSDAAGAIHGAEPRDEETFVEILTHEAGHLWLNLLTEKDPKFIANPYEEQWFLSPWRGDLRPILGIVHGTYVFSFVVLALLAVGTPAARARAAQLSVEVKDAARQVLTFGVLSPVAAEVVTAAKARVVAAEPSFSAGEIASACERYATEKERKVRTLRERNPELLVVEGLG